MEQIIAKDVNVGFESNTTKSDIYQKIDELIRELEFAVKHNEGVKRDCYQRSLNLVRQKLTQ